MRSAMIQKCLLMLVPIWWLAAGELRSQTGVNLTAVTINATDANGNLLAQERWNTIAPHPAWEVWVKDGPIPGNLILNDEDDEENRTIDVPLALGENIFTVGVSHIIGGDLCCDGYSLNLFINGSPTAENGEEAPSITGWVEPNRDGPDAGSADLEEQPIEGGAMGFPLQTFPPAALDYEEGDYQVELTDFVFYAKSAGLDIDVMSTGSHTGPFIPDGEPDAVGQFTVVVTRIRGGLLGDYNSNGVIDAGDFDEQATGMMNNDPAFDLDGDGDADVDDRLVLINDIANTWAGDSNFDGEFGSGDLVTVFTEGKFETGEAATWAQGDWDGDKVFGTGDLVFAFTLGGYELGIKPAAAAVPEPSSLVLLSLAGLLAIRRRMS